MRSNLEQDGCRGEVAYQSMTSKKGFALKLWRDDEQAETSSASARETFVRHCQRKVGRGLPGFRGMLDKGERLPS